MAHIKRVRWGILGAAKITRKVAPAIQASSNGVAIAIASRDLSKAKEAAQQYGIRRALGSYEALLADDEIDAVYIPLPNSFHRTWTIRVAQVGKHVLCEKPLGISVAECEEMKAVCEAHDVVLMEALMYHFHPQITRSRELVEAGAIGQVRLVRSAFSFPLLDSSNIRHQQELGGGVLFDAGCYCVSALRLMVGEEPTEVFAFAQFGGKTHVDEMMAGQLRFPSGTLAMFDCSFSAQFRQLVEVVGTEGKIDLMAPFLPRLDDVTIVVRRGDAVEKILVPETDHYRLMIEHFNDCILKGQIPVYPAEDAVHNMRAIDALHASAREGRRIVIGETGNRFQRRD